MYKLGFLLYPDAAICAMCMWDKIKIISNNKKSADMVNGKLRHVVIQLSLTEKIHFKFKLKQDAEGIQNMFGVYLMVLTFTKWKQL